MKQYGFLSYLVFIFLFHPFLSNLYANDNPENKMTATLIEEMTIDERKQQAESWIQKGDELYQGKDYNRANEAYEQVFKYEPDNVEASSKIDRLKKTMLKEGKTESHVVGGVYDEEIEMRSREYWTQARNFYEAGRLGQARLTLEKLLLINPLHEEGRKLYERLKAELEE